MSDHDEESAGGVYHRTTVYLTTEQLRWLRQLAAQALIDGVPLSNSDVVRTGLDRLREVAPGELRTALVDHVHAEATQYPGRRKRGMPATG